MLTISAADVKFTPKDDSSHPFEDPVLELSEPTKGRIEEAAALLCLDEVVAFPTETVYGLGANALADGAASKIYAAKNRPADNPLILHVASLRSLRRLLPAGSPIPRIYEPLIARYWPGPLTILLPLDRRHSEIGASCTSGQDTFAVRMPQSPLALALIHTADRPLAAPSANTSTRPSPTTAQHVLRDLTGRIPLILDGGPCRVGLESTVVDGLTHPPQILRPGGVSLEQIRAVPGWESTVVHRPGVQHAEEVPRTPGMKYRHYSPTARIVLFESTAREPDVATLTRVVGGGGGIALDPATLAICRTRRWPIDLHARFGPGVADFPLGTSGADISRRLFALLRDLDDRGITTVLIEGIAEADEGMAVMNRLRKAATVVVDE